MHIYILSILDSLDLLPTVQLLPANDGWLLLYIIYEWIFTCFTHLLYATKCGKLSSLRWILLSSLLLIFSYINLIIHSYINLIIHLQRYPWVCCHERWLKKVEEFKWWLWVVTVWRSKSNTIWDVDNTILLLWNDDWNANSEYKTLYYINICQWQSLIGWNFVHWILSH